ncbi:septation ring formation regulator [Gracilibacillus ureilyticus]|uniref:Septation ring formation regulator EzrA n=1 Tax=Gracilibacillus ureilyticus TaxID=531814 RepID=A0A1H9UCK8_9BACI|nr:septation ring formation regulator EzrA [Gracilibacillus ureilyticus]SES07089.1 septation ring formation regulator [Gracilibacillus ureilyticus]
MEFVIGGILIIITLMIVGLILRRKVYDQVDRLEEWKMNIMSRNVTAELGKIKQLNLLGETQEKFEKWKEEWDNIVTKTLPDMEEDLLDVEELANRFNIPAAKKRLILIEQSLQSIDESIDQIFKDLEHLLDSEKYTKEQIDIIGPQLKDLKKYLLHNRTQFGKAELFFEQKLTKLEKKLESHHELEEGGNYLAAQQMIDELKEEMRGLDEELSVFPELYRKCKKTLPEQMKELLREMSEMAEEGLRVEQFGFEKELKQYENMLKETIFNLENGEMSDADETLEQMEIRLNEMVVLLEKEETSKSIVENELPKLKNKTDELNNAYLLLKQEINELQKTYYIESADLEMFLSIEKWLDKLDSQFDQMERDYEMRTSHHLDIKERLDNFLEDVKKLEQAQTEFYEKVRDLRKDEVEAVEMITDLKRDLSNTNKQLMKSNIPGVPSSLLNLLDESTDKCEVVLSSLQKHPLDMAKVQHSLDEARKSVSNFVNQTTMLLDQARLVEVAIQYGNRYRRNHPVLAAQLREAEALFRNYKYEAALEMAVRAIEEIDDQAMKKIEQLDEHYQEMLS